MVFYLREESNAFKNPWLEALDCSLWKFQVLEVLWVPENVGEAKFLCGLFFFFLIKKQKIKNKKLKIRCAL